MDEAYSILVIDDSEDDVVLYRRLMRTDPRIKTVRSAGTGAEGIASYEAEPVDCVLLDYHMPGEDGCAVMRQLRERDKHAAVIMLSGQDSDQIMAAALDGGASDYIIKDKISALGLHRAVRNAVLKAGLHRRLDAQQAAYDKLLMKLIHDLRAPLRHASSFAAFLGEDVAEARYAELAAYPGKIQGALLRANSLIDMLYAYLQIEPSAELAPTSLRAAVDAAAGELAPLIKARGARLEFGPLPSVAGHAGRLVELLHQLIANAILHNESAAPVIRIGATPAENGAWRISIEDNGVGVPEDRLATIFDPFHRLCSQDKVPGTGLGLAICRKIAEAHGGRIWCESEPGKGSAFHFTLADATSAAAEGSRSAA